jgi:methylated-DNA-[protein]-cysteine S-methyltransferase
MSEFRQRAAGAPRIMMPLKALSRHARARDIMTERFYSEAFDTPTGCMVLVTDAEDRLRAVEWEDKASRLERSLRLHYGEHGYQLHAPRAKSAARVALEAYFEGELGAIEAIRTQTRGTDFQRSVWSALRKIPMGTTVSYGQLAAKIGRPAAVRAVGAANGANPIPIIVPCHRVIGADSSLTGFGGGLERKRWLLAHERTYAPSSGPHELELRV